MRKSTNYEKQEEQGMTKEEGKEENFLRKEKEEEWKKMIEKGTKEKDGDKSRVVRFGNEIKSEYQ